jgi:hypothetical protein
MTTKKLEKTSPKFFCDNCDFKCCTNTDWNRHIATAKHAKTTNNNEKNLKNLTSKHVCDDCEKKYNDRAGLWRHKKKCVEFNSSSCDMSSNAILEIVKQNREFQQIVIEQQNLAAEQNKLLMEQQKTITELVNKPSTINNTTNSNNTNSNNKFNLNFFLNEQCKDALNITDFVNSLKLQLEDLENTGKYGFVEGISRIFIKGLKELDIHKRPIHCSDLKRETMYVKDQNIWEKENSEKIKLYKTIGDIAHKNINQIPVWSEKNPDSCDSESKKNDMFLQIIYESMGGNNEEETNKYYDKIVKNVSREVTIN